MGQVKRPLLLDGALGQEIVNRGGKSGYGEWAIAALHENPQIVADIHRDYIQAGADVITTNTYSTSRTRLKHVGMEDRFAELVNVAGSLAKTAREQASTPHVKIAASLGPLEASYISNFALSYDEMIAQFRELMDLLDPYVDIYLGETFSTTLESRAFLTAAQRRSKPVWVSWTLHDHSKRQLRGDEALQAAIASLSGFTPDAILINCCTPDSINEALPLLRATGLPFGGYANGFVEIPATWEENGDVQQLASRDDLTPEVYATHVQKWLAAGASIVGGCCDVGPAHIAAIAKVLSK